MADDELEEDTTGNGTIVKFEDFYHGRMDQPQADELLSKYEPDNYYLVRERVITENSKNSDEQFCISLHTRVNGLPRKVHFRIRQSYDLCVIGGLVFHSLAELVTYYTQIEILTGARLEHPIPPSKHRPANSYVIVIKNYSKSAGTDELSVTAGDVCSVQHKNNEGWMYVTHIRSKMSGWVFGSLVEDLDSPNYDPDLETCEVYHPSRREERIEELKTRPTGTYFLRPSGKSANISVLCVNCTGAIKKFEIEKGPSGRNFILSGREFESIDDVIRRYSQTYIDKENRVMLREPLLRRSQDASSGLPLDDIYAVSRGASMQARESQLVAEAHCLFPKRRSRLRADWKRHRCALHRRRGDNYEVLIGDKPKTKGLIALEFAHLYPVCQGVYDKPHCLQLVIFNEASANSTPPDVYVLAFDTQQTLDEWFSAVKPLCKCSKVCNQGLNGGEMTVKVLRNLNANCKTAFVSVLFNGVVVAKTRVNRREQDDESALNWDENFHFDCFPDCIHTVSLQVIRCKTPKNNKLLKVEVPVSELTPGRTLDFRLPAGPDRLQLSFSIRRVSYVVLVSTEYVQIRDILVKSEPVTECLRALGEVCQTDEFTYLARAIYKVFAYYNRAASLLTSLLISDILSISSESEGVMFRTTTIGTAVLEVYLLTDEPLQFVRNCLGEMVNEIVSNNVNLELKTERLLHSSGDVNEPDEAEAVARRNAARLNELLLNCMRRTLEHCQAGHCPAILHQVSVACQQETTKRFPQAAARVLSAFYFLRLFCPALTTKFRLVFGAQLRQDVSSQVMRSLQLAAKTLQLFANQTKSFRETCMELVKPFVCDNEDLFNQLNDCLTSPPKLPPVSPRSNRAISSLNPELPSSSSAATAAGPSSSCSSASPPDSGKNFSLKFELSTVHDFCARHLDELRKLQARSGGQNLHKLIVETELLSAKLSGLADKK